MSVRMMFLWQFAFLAAALASATEKGAPHYGQALGGQRPRGVALIITGAAARIPQEAALIQALDERGFLKDPVCISGESPGSLNAVAYNAIRSGRTSWKRYREILSGLRNEDIFVRTEGSCPWTTPRSGPC
jgi:predicted acylesterase/phospholipase RssA